MTDVTLLQKKAERGKEAEVLLANKLFREIGEACKREWFNDFSGEDDIKAEKARQNVRAFEKFLNKIVKIHREGIEAHKKIRKLQSRQEQGLSNDPNDLQGIA